MRSWVWTLALVVACSPGGDDGNTTDDTDDTVDTDTDTDVEEDTDDPCMDPPVGPGGDPVIDGTTTQLNGDPVGLVDIAVRYCNGATCISAQAQDCDGNYALWALPEGTGTLEILPIQDDSDYATFVSVIPVDSTTDRTIDVVVPTYTNTHDLTSTATEYEAAPGLFITVADTDLQRPTPLEPEPTQIRGVDATDSGAGIMEGLTGTIRAVYYLSPFDYEASSPLPVRLTNSWGFADGEAELWLAEYSADWVNLGDLVDDGNGDLTISGGLPRISTIVVLEKP